MTWSCDREDLVELIVDEDNPNRCTADVIEEFTGPVYIRAEWNGLRASCTVYCRAEAEETEG